MATGFVKLNRAFLQDGNTLLVAGVRDESGNVIASNVRVLPPDATADAALAAFAEMYGSVPVTALRTVFGRAALN